MRTSIVEQPAQQTLRLLGDEDSAEEKDLLRDEGLSTDKIFSVDEELPGDDDLRPEPPTDKIE